MGEAVEMHAVAGDPDRDDWHEDKCKVVPKMRE